MALATIDSQWIAIVFTGTGAVVALVVAFTNSKNKSNKEEKEAGIKEGTVSTEITYIKKEIMDPHHGLSALREAIENQTVFCTKTTERQNGIIHNLEGQVADIEIRHAKEDSKK